MSPFELMIGTKMRHSSDVSVLEILEKEATTAYSDDREIIRQQAKAAILVSQEEQRRQYNKKSKAARSYKIGDIVAIKKTQFETAAKLKPKFVGPYRVVKINGRDRYQVERLGQGEGPGKTSSCADHMKMWGLVGTQAPRRRPTQVRTAEL